MSDKILDTTQVVNGLAVLLSFYVGYKYAIKKHVKEAGEAVPVAEEVAAGPSNVFSDFGNNYKMVLVVRNDLKMGKGKIGSQCGHAAVGAYQRAIKRIPHVVRRWEESGSAKIALKVESEKDLHEIMRTANVSNLNTCLIRDAGRTQIEPNTKTVLAIGPGVASEIDRVTGHLKLL